MGPKTTENSSQRQIILINAKSRGSRRMLTRHLIGRTDLFESTGTELVEKPGQHRLDPVLMFDHPFHERRKDMPMLGPGAGSQRDSEAVRRRMFMKALE